jgi:hypothetical protein
LKKHNPLGGLPVEIYDLLAADVDARDAVVRALLHRFFHDSPTAEALRLTGLDDTDAGPAETQAGLVRAEDSLRRPQDREQTGLPAVSENKAHEGRPDDDPVGPLDDLASRGEPLSGLPNAIDLLTELVGIEIRTASGKSNTILQVRGDNVVVRTERSSEGQSVPVGTVQRGLDLLAARGSVRVAPEELGYRSSFVGAVLAVLPGARFTGKPAVVVLDALPIDDTARDHHNGGLDAIAQVKIRLEQARLRSLLAGGRASARCALCGDPFPLAFLVAAHIKKPRQHRDARLHVRLRRPLRIRLDHRRRQRTRADTTAGRSSARQHARPSQPPGGTPLHCLQTRVGTLLRVAPHDDLRNNKLSLTLPVLFHERPDQRKKSTGTSAGAVHRRSKPSHVVRLFRLLQICSTHCAV